MSGSIKIPHEIGESLWWTGHGSREEWIQCEECLGTKKVKLILPNGETYQLDCRNCGNSWEEPRGEVQITIHAYRPTVFVPRRVDISGDEIKYSESDPSASCYSMTPAENLFKSSDECQKKCDELTREKNAWEKDQPLRNRMNSRRDYAWNVHYWRRQKGNLIKDLEAIERRLGEIKEKKERGEKK